MGPHQSPVRSNPVLLSKIVDAVTYQVRHQCDGFPTRSDIRHAVDVAVEGIISGVPAKRIIQYLIKVNDVYDEKSICFLAICGVLDVCCSLTKHTPQLLFDEMLCENSEGDNNGASFNRFVEIFHMNGAVCARVCNC